MFTNPRRATVAFAACFSFVLGCTVTLFVLHGTALMPTGPPPSRVVDGRLKLLVLVVSAVKNQNRRDVIRETWASQGANGGVRVLFAVSRDRRLAAEKLVHDDLLEVSVPDGYQLLSRKLSESLDGVRHVDFEYLLKCDDDTFVDVPRVVGELERAPRRKFCWGYFDGNARVKRAGKWKETGWTLCDRYLPYALGGGYVLSKDLVTYIVNNRDYFNLYVSEDVSVGVWLAPLNITRKHDRRFDTEFRSRGCRNDHLVTHKQSPQAMRLYWSNIVKTGKMCDKEYKDMSSYEYDWTATPSKCCLRNSSLHP